MRKAAIDPAGSAADDFYMTFLYESPRIPLESLCGQRHLISRQAASAPRPVDRVDGTPAANAQWMLARAGDIAMLDLLMLALGFGLFAVSVGYAIACDRL
jgi:hypothetical protein